MDIATPKPVPPMDWPDPVEVVNESGLSDIVLTCEHASNHIPAEYRSLGVSAPDLQRHIAWDIGVAGITRSLAALLDAPAFLGTYSRLLIDLNRPLDSGSSIPQRSESTDIPGNLRLDPLERQRRADAIFHPFHDCISAHLDKREKAGRRSRIVGIHSFTPVFYGKQRPWHAGVLCGKSRDYAESIVASLREDTSLTVDLNVPYVIDRNDDYAVPVHGEDRNYPAILIEVRQDLLADADGISLWTEKLFAALRKSGDAGK
ncbi:N-formylglutamate amidohydrolase [Phyllobacterium sp. SB3]|uniref:N-formylglutamate amidohydrolase n=1 Tax=Phyllobacterium sp. SB3 TaxID=3156073 RepID=UPI0032AE8D6B